MEKQLKRSNIQVFMSPSETAIYNALQEVEKIGADVRLTEAVIHLQKARELVGNYIDEAIQS